MSDRRKEDKRAELREALTMVVLVLNFVVLGAVGFLNIYLLDQNGQRVEDIQQSRKTTIFTACVEQNKRNVAAQLFLQGLPPSPNQPKRTPEETDKLLRGFTDALVGRRHDCFKRVDQLVK